MNQQAPFPRLKRVVKLKILERYLSACLSPVQHAVLSFIYDRTDRYNKRWEIVSIKQITDGIFTSDNEIVHQGVMISRTTAINAINALLEQDLIHRRPKNRLGTIWYEYSINWTLLQEAAEYFHTDPFEQHEDWGN